MEKYPARPTVRPRPDIIQARPNNMRVCAVRLHRGNQRLVKFKGPPRRIGHLALIEYSL